ncbi:MAG TPA: hypothetical protein VE974_29900 [Thermoanaerobaculia bacterium]|nr:hypothetical protein [Thermoanaerobaculia bacterium]
MKIHHIDGVGHITRPSMQNFGSLAVNRVMGDVAYPVYGDDSTVLPHLIAADIGGKQVLSDDGGPAPFDASVLVYDGRILGVRRERGQLREVFETTGSSFVFTGDPKDLQEDIVITETDGKQTFDPLPKPPKDGWIVTGVAFTSDDTITGTVFAESEMSLPGK